MSAEVLIALLGLIVAITASGLAYQALFPTKREVVHGVETAYRLLDTPAAGDLTVRHGDRVLAGPYVVEYGLACTGRADVTSPDFDGGQPFTLVFDQPVVVDLTPPVADRLGYRWAEHTGPHGPCVALCIGPTLLRHGGRYTFTLLLDGDPDTLTITVGADPLQNTRVVRRADHIRLRRLRRTVACYTAAGSFAVAGAVAALGPFGANPLAGVVLLAGATAPLSLGLVLASRRG